MQCFRLLQAMLLAQPRHAPTPMPSASRPSPARAVTSALRLPLLDLPLGDGASAGDALSDTPMAARWWVRVVQGGWLAAAAGVWRLARRWPVTLPHGDQQHSKSDRVDAAVRRPSAGRVRLACVRHVRHTLRARARVCDMSGAVGIMKTCREHRQLIGLRGCERSCGRADANEQMSAAPAPARA